MRRCSHPTPATPEGRTLTPVSADTSNISAFPSSPAKAAGSAPVRNAWPPRRVQRLEQRRPAPGIKCAAISSSSAIGAMPDISATRRACASTSPTRSAFCSPVEALAAGASSARGARRDRRHAARSASAPPRRRERDCGKASRGSGPPPRAPGRRPPAPRPRLRAQDRAQGKGEASSRPATISASSRLTQSTRAAATATPSSAASRSIASSQPALRALLLEQLVAPAQGALELIDPRAVSGIDRKHETVEKAAPLARRPGTDRSIAGVSQTSRTWSAKARAEATGARSMRLSRSAPRLAVAGLPARRRADGARRPPRPRSIRAKPPAPPTRAQAASSARRKAAPGREQRKGLEEIGLARAVLAAKHDQAALEREIERRIGAEIPLSISRAHRAGAPAARASEQAASGALPRQPWRDGRLRRPCRRRRPPECAGEQVGMGAAT